MRKHIKTQFTAAAVVVFTVAACDTSVTNPGPTQDAFLDSLVAHDAIVTGARRSLADAMNNIVYWNAAMTFELNPAGSTGSFGIPARLQAGTFDEDLSGDWDNISQARWVAEDAIRRFEEVLPLIENAPDASTYEPIAIAALYAGYANRVFGDHFCQVVFNTPDGAPGSAEPHTAAWQRAVGFFEKARTVATANGSLPDIVDAANAGLAQVHTNLATYGISNWSDATGPAGTIADDFVFEMPYFALDQDQFNRIHFANGNEPYRAHTQWATFYQDWGFEATKGTGDPRTPWRIDPVETVGDAAVDKFGGNVTWFPQDKHNARNSPINLASGYEMRLIEAEANLAQNGAAAVANVQTVINNRRGPLGLAAVTLADEAAAWVELKRERAFEMWIEGRRMGDIRRWNENSVGGGLADLHDGVWMDTTGDGINDTRVEDMSTHDVCYLIGQNERESNPNIPN